MHSAVDEFAGNLKLWVTVSIFLLVVINYYVDFAHELGMNASKQLVLLYLLYPALSLLTYFFFSLAKNTLQKQDDASLRKLNKLTVGNFGLLGLFLVFVYGQQTFAAIGILELAVIVTLGGIDLFSSITLLGMYFLLMKRYRWNNESSLKERWKHVGNSFQQGSHAKRFV